MGINLDKPHKWKQDIKESVDMYNDWFMNFAPETFRRTRLKTTDDVLNTLSKTEYYKNVTPQLLANNPEILSTLRMSTCPPIAVDRLIGLAGVNANLVKQFENNRKPPLRMSTVQLDIELSKICTVILKLIDKDIFPWLSNTTPIDVAETHRAATIIADRLCGSIANPIIRNAQEKRQLDLIKKWLEKQGYKQLTGSEKRTLDTLNPGTFAFHFYVQVKMDTAIGYINIPVDVAIKPKNKRPVLIEAKSAGDFANVNKRRKEEAQKMSQLRSTYGDKINFILFLCGYFDSGYLGYEAAEGIDWIWEHSIDDLEYYVV
ncbi:MAG: XamI family restriction endonuclease [Treponema sp.]|nr:XamI family restriction endonuclease [Treponema sp.]